jgi:ribonuclease BN (tRNA processing enzyme)
VLAAATILGSGGFVPTGRRETSSLLLLPGDEDAAVVVDAGTGLRRLVTDPGLLQGREELHVVLTHFHIDHITGLPYLTELVADHRIWVHGPGAALYGTTTFAILGRIFTHPVMPVGLIELGVEVRDLWPGEVEIGGLPLRARRQECHTDPTLGLRLGDDLTWCTDTEADPRNAELAEGCRVLCHDAWGPPAAPGHPTPAEAAQVAVDAGVERLVLIHVPPNADEDRMRAQAGEVHPHVTVGTDELDLLAL